MNDTSPGIPPSGHRTVTLSVDGEVFVVSERQGDSRTYDYDWASGPNAGYGFSRTAHLAFFSVSDRADTPSGFSPATLDEHRAAIRDFLAQIDPDTGYLGN